MVGLQAGEHVWTAAFGFLITAVGLPVLTVVALAKVGGGVDSLSTPIGKVAGVLLATWSAYRQANTSGLRHSASSLLPLACRY
ncbi:branched-chain amino acid transport domain protein [Escherichia coli JB1-95]|nr:branched-chain amino acid transport domain protein [Escherichia coli JB1-95]